MRRNLVDAEHGADDLHFVPKALGEERSDRAVDHASVKRGLLGGLALALEKASRDLTPGVCLLLDVDGKRKEVRTWAGVLCSDDGGEHHGVSARHDDCAVCLLG